ncbi:hypothetical protein VYU27_008263 [Nannochloropsis oceanica]
MIGEEDDSLDDVCGRLQVKFFASSTARAPAEGERGAEEGKEGLMRKGKRRLLTGMCSDERKKQFVEKCLQSEANATAASANTGLVHATRNRRGEEEEKEEGGRERPMRRDAKDWQ